MARSTTIPPASVQSLLAGFVDYLREQRGVSVLTVAAYVTDVRRFVAGRGDASSLRGLTAAEVSHAVLGDVDGRSQATVRRYDAAMHDTGMRLLRGFSTAIGEAPDFFGRFFMPATTALTEAASTGLPLRTSSREVPASCSRHGTSAAAAMQANTAQARTSDSSPSETTTLSASAAASRISAA